MNFENQLSEANFELLSHIGQRVYTDRIESSGDLKKFRINCDFPIVHIDKDTGKTILKQISFENIGEGEIIKKSVKLPELSKINEKILQRMNIWTEQSEIMVVSATAEKLALLPETKFKLEPINDIMTYLYYYEEIPKSYLQNNIKAAKYMALLEDIELVKEKNDAITYTKELVALMHKKKQDDKIEYDKFFENVCAFVIDKSYPTLKSTFGFKAVEQYVRIENTYYLSSVEAEKLLKINKDELIHEYKRKYFNIPEQFINLLKFTKDLHVLGRLDILKIKDDSISGDNDVFDTLMEKRNYLVNHVRTLY